jgi:hypothetical protein
MITAVGLTYKPNWAEALRNWQPVITQLVKKLLVFHGTRRFITVFKTVYHCILSLGQMNLVQFLTPYFFKIYFYIFEVKWTLKMTVIRSSEVFLTTYKTTRRHNPEGHNRNLQRLENTESHTLKNEK